MLANMHKLVIGSSHSFPRHFRYRYTLQGLKSMRAFSLSNEKPLLKEQQEVLNIRNEEEALNFISSEDSQVTKKVLSFIHNHKNLKQIY